MSQFKCDELYNIIRNEDWDKARIILRSQNSQEQAEYVCCKGRNALHLACDATITTPLCVLKSLLAASSSAPLRRDIYGRTPLHVAIDEGGHRHLTHDESIFYDELIIMVIKACPQAASIVDNSKETPLHYAIYWGASPEVFKHLLAANSSAIFSPNKGGITPILLFFEVWNIGLRRVLQSIEGCKSSFCVLEVHHMNTITKRKISEVHNIAKLLLQANNNECQNSMTSFKLAKISLMKTICPWSIFDLILKTEPGIAFQHDENKNFLLHIAATCQTSIDGNLYKCNLCESQISKYWSIDVDDWFRFCNQCIRNESERDITENLLVMNSVDKIPTTIKDLIRYNAKAASIPNKDCRLPLHLAIEQERSFDEGGVKDIFEAAPMSLETRDMTLHMYPFMMAAAAAAAIGIDSCINTTKQEEDVSKICLQKFTLCYNLLTENPNLVSNKIK